MDTVEKRILLETEASKAVIEILNPHPMMKIFLELLVTEQANAMRTNLKNQVLWINHGE